mgnify:CR=1 FL=1
MQRGLGAPDERRIVAEVAVAAPRRRQYPFELAGVEPQLLQHVLPVPGRDLGGRALVLYLLPQGAIEFTPPA